MGKMRELGRMGGIGKLGKLRRIGGIKRMGNLGRLGYLYPSSNRGYGGDFPTSCYLSLSQG